MGTSSLTRTNIKMGLSTYILIAATLSSGLIAGLLYAFVCAVKPGLGSLTDQEYLRAMQAINRNIENPLFFLSFIGTLILLPVHTYNSFTNSGVSVRFIILLCSSVIYFMGVFGVTILGNVPLNDYLAKVDIGSLKVNEIKAIRIKYEHPWNNLHQIRTWASFISFSLLVLCCIINQEGA